MRVGGSERGSVGELRSHCDTGDSPSGRVNLLKVPVA